MATSLSAAQKVRAKLNHPVIDADGHTLHLTGGSTDPVFLDYVRQVGGGDMEKRVMSRYQGRSSPPRSGESSSRPGWTGPWWITTARTLDFATGSLPKLLNHRMDELGIDYAVLYPTGLGGWTYKDTEEEVRQVLCRAGNMYQMDLWGQYPDRMTPAGGIPMGTPQEAITELEYSVKVLGFKAVVLPAYARRHEGPQTVRLDVFGIDSDYDYDPVWAKCVELGVAPTFHTIAQGLGFRATSNYMYNHIGHFAASAEACSKALFFGGVTYRFPDLRFGFLECGAGWACNLYSDLIGHWQKRGGHVIQRLDPANRDKEQLIGLVEAYGDPRVQAKLPEFLEILGRPSRTPTELDEFASCHIQREEDIRDRFIPNFFFGCEADDPQNASAFNTKVNPFGARLHAMFGSDISHWDVADMTEPVHEAYEMVEDGLLTEEDFRDFVFTNGVRLYAGTNPDFYKGTRVESEAAKVLKSDAANSNTGNKAGR